MIWERHVFSSGLIKAAAVDYGDISTENPIVIEIKGKIALGQQAFRQHNFQE